MFKVTYIGSTANLLKMFVATVFVVLMSQGREGYLVFMSVLGIPKCPRFPVLCLV